MVGWNSLAVIMVLGACVYVILNTGLVSLVISLAEGRPLKELWSSCYEWTFPYFLVGAAVAGLAAAASHGTNLAAGLLIMPVMYFIYVYYKMHIVRVVIESISSVSQENEAALATLSEVR
jgi:surface polysaccharide O-acyltransferase-like enzyme